ncbi:hypothetical protein TIFTF001_006779 [Ficus carica]|uniref:Uncharacterized protein n=1 Tax=Ficus carica TaxID=3494 RepID=A0AA87ZPN8_FICCA|nr:hypothetical protein TIFTF001_006779 [Ficus carica]
MFNIHWAEVTRLITWVAEGRCRHWVSGADVTWTGQFERRRERWQRSGVPCSAQRGMLIGLCLVPQTMSQGKLWSTGPSLPNPVMVGLS